MSRERVSVIAPRPCRSTLGMAALVGAVACLPATTSAADDTSKAGRAISIVGSPALVPVGAACRVELRPEAVAPEETRIKTYEGTITRSDAEGLTVGVAAEEMRVRIASPLSDVPYLGRLFTNLGIGRAQHDVPREVRVPAEAIRTVTLTPTPR